MSNKFNLEEPVRSIMTKGLYCLIDSCRSALKSDIDKDDRDEIESDLEQALETYKDLTGTEFKF